MAKQNILGKTFTTWEFKEPNAINATAQLTTAEILTQSLYAVAGTLAPINLTLPTAATLYIAMNAIKTPVIGDTIPLRIFNGSVFPLTLLNTVDALNYITLGLAGGNTCIVPPSCQIDLKISLAAVGPVKYFISGAPTRDNFSILNVTGNKTLALSDYAFEQYCTSAAIITIPTNAAVPFPIGTIIPISRITASAVSVDVSNITPLSINNYYAIANTNGTIYIQKVDTNTWKFTGNVGP